MSVGQEGDNRQYRRLKKNDYYESKAAAEAHVATYERCRTCGRILDDSKKNWNGYCLQCFNEPKS